MIDGAGGVLGATLSYTLTAANDPVTGAATAVLAAGSEGAAYTVTLASLLAGFSDVDIATNGQVLSVVGLLASSGSIAANPDGSYTITQAANFNGPVTLSYSVTDGNGSTVGASLGYGVTAANDPPILTGTQALLAAGTEDTAYFVSLADLLAGFTDVNVATNGQVLSIANLLPSNGLAVLGVNALGNAGYTITPTLDFNGAVSLTYNVIDGAGGVLGATLSYTLNAVNDLVTGSATALLAAGTEGSAYTVTLASLLTGFSDVDIATNGQALSVVGLLASSGTVVANLDGSYTITQATDFNGPVSLSYSVTDGNGSTVPAGQSYAVTAVNDLPALTGLQAALAAGTEDTAYFVSFASLLAGFSDVDVATNGQVLSIANLVAANGTVVPSLDGLGYTITPALNFNGTMALTYNVIDGNLGSIAASQSYAVTAVNDAPVGTATAALVAGTEDTAYVVSAASLLAGFSDVDTGDILSVAGLSASNGTVVNNNNGTYTVTPAYNFNGAMGLAYSVIDGNGGSIAASQSYSVTAVIDVPNLDFDGDGKSDILWRNTATGADVIWKSGNSATTQAVAGVANQDWKIVGTGDFNFDGKSDILWRNTATGANTIWKSGNNLTVQAVATVADLNMKVVATGDFNGDGTSDILWRNSVTGANTIWKGGDSASVQAVAGVANQDWKVVGTGDFDGNGTSDILWRNTATGANTIWKGGESATVQAVAAVTNQNWNVVGTGDFNGDGKTDILWRNSVTGGDTIWRSGNSATVQAVATVADQNWKIAGTGDYDGDGKADILWRNTATGADVIWKSGNNATVQAVAGVASQDWSMVDGLETGDLLNGGAGSNTLYGTLRNDVLFGSTGRDTMTGGAGADTFVFTALNQSGITAASRDVITDFVNGTDRIDLSGIDAKTTVIGNDAFTFIGNGVFAGGGAAGAGQLRYSFAGTDTIVEGDVDGDGLADFQIQLTGNRTMTVADMVV